MANANETSPANSDRTLRDEWCECEHGFDDPIYMPDDCCPCGEDKHHYHCSTCKGISQVG